MTTSAARAARPRTGTSLLALLRMTRPDHIALVVVIFTNGSLLAAWREPGAGLASLTAVGGSLALALVLLIVTAASVHLANEAADAETDRISRRTAYSGGSGALQASGLQPRVPLLAALALAGIVTVAIPIALGAELMEPAAGMLVLVGLAGGLSYSLPPIAAMRRGWGEPLNAVLGGLALPLLGVAVVSGSFAPVDVLAFLPLAFVVFASVLATAWPDREADAATGKRTLQVRLAPAVLRSMASLSLVAFIAATAVSVIWDVMPAAWAGLAVVPLLLIGLRRYTRRRNPVANVAAMIGLTTVTSLVLVASLATREPA